MLTVPQAALNELRALYLELDAVLQPISGRCEASGRCCHFKVWGHRLYLTGLEAAEMCQETELSDAIPLQQGSCPYLKGTQCGNRNRRALGCRMYFCDRTHEPARNEVYEAFLKRIREIETRYAIEHYYASLDEWFGSDQLPELEIRE